MLALDSYQLAGDNEFHEATNFINKYIPLESYMPWLMPSFPQSGLAMLTQPLGLFPYRQAKIGRFYWPTMMSRFAYGHFLCDSDTVGNIVADAYNSDGSYNQIKFQIGNPESNADMNNQGGTIFPAESISTMVYLLPPTPLTGIRGLSGQITSLYLLTIVDSRYFYWFQNVGDIQIDQSTTWQELFDMLFTSLGNNIQYTVDTINNAYLAPSVQMFTLPYEPIPPVLDAVAWNVGQRICANFDGSFSTQLYNTALNVLNSDMQANPNRTILSGGQRFSNPL